MLTKQKALLATFVAAATISALAFAPQAVHAGGNYCSTLGNPLLTKTISQGYHSTHKALDMKAAQGTLLRSAGNGVVINVTMPKVDTAKPARIAIVHDNGTKTEYMQLSKIAVKKGDFVAKGQVIGRTGGKPGTAGAYRSTGPHFHFALYNKDGKALNPYCIVQK